MLVSALALTSCDIQAVIGDLLGGNSGNTCANGHVDADGDKICDNCNKEVPKTPSGSEQPEEPEREPTYKISFNYHGVVYEDKMDEEGAVVTDSSGRPIREGIEQDVEVYVLDVLQNQAPTAEQLLEIPGITYGGVTIVGWYDSPELENEVNFEEVITADKKVYAKLKTMETDKRGNYYCGEDVTWKITFGDVLQIDGEGAMYDFTDPELVPWYFEEDGVTRRKIKKIKIGDEITHIGSYSFYNLLDINKASNIEMGSVVTSIGNYAFAYSTALDKAPLTENITVIGRSAFEGCASFRSIVIPDSVVEIKGYAFARCTSFTYLVLGSGVKKIDEFAFNQRPNTKVGGDPAPAREHEYIYYRGTPEQYEEIVVQLGNFKFLSNGAYLYFLADLQEEYESGKLGPYWIYDGEGAPKHLTFTIRYMAPGNIESHSNAEIAGNPFPILTDYVLIDEDGTGMITQENLDKLSALVYRGYKFESWGNAKYTGENPDKVDKHLTFTGVRGYVVGDNAKYSYDSYNRVLSIEGSGRTWDYEGVGDTVFYKRDITSIKFDEGITYLGSNIFGGISTLISVEIPATVTEVHPKVFSGCTNLAAIYYLGDDISDCKGLDSLVGTDAVVYAKGSEDFTGEEGSFWQDMANGTRLAWLFKDGVLTIGGDDEMPNFEVGGAPWAKYTNVKELVISSNIVKIGENAFAGMKGIEKLTFHEALFDIPRSAFANSDYWKNDANWENGALMAGEHLLAFDERKITTPYAVVPQATKIITADAFEDCGSITQLVLPAYFKNIDDTAFDGLTGVVTVYYYGQNVNAWNLLPEGVRADLSSAKILYRSGTNPASNPGDFWRNVNKVPTAWDQE